MCKTVLLNADLAIRTHGQIVEYGTMTPLSWNSNYDMIEQHVGVGYAF